ncbi:MAG: hypothetical protein ACI8Z7_000580 [Candidatus Nanohaloarchaea archaeon]
MTDYDETALVVTHPHEEFDEGTIYDNLSQIVPEIDVDTYAVESSNVESSPYLQSQFDEVLKDEAFGRLTQEDAQKLYEEKEHILLGGGFIEMCAENTYETLLEAGFEGEDITIVPEITYDQSFPDDKYSVQDVLETGDVKIISDYLQSSNNELVGRAMFNGEYIGDVEDDIHRASEMTVEEAVEDPEVSIDLGFEATPGDESRPKVGV